MAEYMMVMKGSDAGADWTTYVNKLVATGKFRGGSALGNGVCVAKAGADGPCVARGFMRFEVESLDELRALLDGNPVYEAGGEVELLELVDDGRR